MKICMSKLQREMEENFKNNERKRENEKNNNEEREKNNQCNFHGKKKPPRARQKEKRPNGKG